MRIYCLITVLQSETSFWYLWGRPYHSFWPANRWTGTKTIFSHLLHRFAFPMPRKRFTNLGSEGAGDYWINAVSFKPESPDKVYICSRQVHHLLGTYSFSFKRNKVGSLVSSEKMSTSVENWYKIRNSNNYVHHRRGNRGEYGQKHVHSEQTKNNKNNQRWRRRPT